MFCVDYGTNNWDNEGRWWGYGGTDNDNAAKSKQQKTTRVASSSRDQRSYFRIPTLP